MKNYYRFSTSGFANEDHIVSVNIDSQADRTLLAEIKACISDSDGAWIDKYSLRDVQDVFAYRNECRREGVGDNPIGATSITPIADTASYFD